jgi:hypothetical protein
MGLNGSPGENPVLQSENQFLSAQTEFKRRIYVGPKGTTSGCDTASKAQ